MTDADPRVMCTGCANHEKRGSHNYTERFCKNAIFAGLSRDAKRAPIGTEFATMLQNCNGFSEAKK